MKYSKKKALSFLLAILMLMGNVSPAFAKATNDKAEEKNVSSLSNNYTGYSTNYDKQGKDKRRIVVELKDKSISNIANSMGTTVKDLSFNQVGTYEKQILSKQKEVKNVLAANNIQTFATGDDDKSEASYQFTTVMNGFSTYVRSEDINKIKKLRDVKEVYYVSEYNRPSEFPAMITSGGLINTNEAWDFGYKGEGMVVSVLDSGYDMNHKDFKNIDSSKINLTKDKVDRSKKLYNLPGKYYTDKFPYAYNYYDKTDRIISTINNHGQHVAGTVAANGDTENGGIKGVAPEAQLLGMKVFSDDPLYSTTMSDVYVKAIDDSVKLGADAINMSLGSPAGTNIYGSLEDVAINNARKAGVIVAIAAGNEHTIIDGVGNVRDLLIGSQELPYAKNPDTAMIASPSIYTADLSVASINNTKFMGRYIHYVASGKEYKANLSVAGDGAPDPADVLKDTYTGKDIAVINWDNKGEKSEAPGDSASFEGKDVAGKIVLVERGNSFADTAINAQDRGAIGVLVYNNERPDSEILLNMLGGEVSHIPLMITTRSNGLRIIENLDDIKLTFPKEETQLDHPTAGQISNFSSWGPTPELKIKPEIAAPGGDIYSLDNGDSYVSMSGTSMATPHVAGALALVNQRLKKDSKLFDISEKGQRGNLAKLILMNTAVPAKNPSGVDYLVRQQGAGVMDLKAATSTDTYVVEKNSGEGKAEVGSLNNGKIVMDFTIYNKSKQTRKFNVTANALTDIKFKDPQGREYLAEEAKALENITVTGGGRQLVAKNSKKDVRITIDFSKAIEAGEIALDSFIEGYVYFDSLDNKTNLSVPYLGFYGDYEQLNVLDRPSYNLLDDDISNDPMFDATGLIYQVDGEIQMPTPTLNPVYFNSSDKGLGNTGLALRATPLRNYDRIEFALEDKDGNTIQTLGQTLGGRKISGLPRGNNPFEIYEESFWNGKINGNYLEDGQSIYLKANAFFQRDSKAQELRFEIKADNSFPMAGPIDGELKTRKFEREDYWLKDNSDADVILTYDKEKNTIKFRATDDKKGSGINRVTLVNFENGNVTADWTWFGQRDLEYIRKSGDKYDGQYEIELWDDFAGDTLLVEIADGANNIVQGIVEPREASQPANKLPMPEIENGTIIAGQELVNGHIDLANAEVVFEKEENDGRKEIAKAKADAKGNFLADIKDAKVKAGDVIYIYGLADGEKGEELKVVVGQIEEIDPTSDELTMFITQPDLNYAYNEDVDFEITMFGWDNLDRVEFNGSKLPFEVFEKEKVYHPGTKEQVYYGKVFKVNTKLDLEEGYYDIPIMAYDDKNDRSFGITRRFWIDKTAPEISEIITSELSEESKDADGNRVVTITTDKNEVPITFTVKDNGPELAVFRDDTRLSTAWQYELTALKFEPTTNTFNEKINLGNQKEATVVYRAVDIPGNEAKVIVKIVKEEEKVNPEERKPIITASDRTIFVGEKVNPLYQVSAKDYKGNDLTDKIVVKSGKVDNTKPGTYEIEYYVIDSDSNWASKKVIFTVKNRKETNIDKEDLLAKIKEAENIAPDNYSLGSYQDLQRAIEDAKVIDKSIGLSQEDIDNMVEKLDKAIKDLVDISKLSKLYEYAKDEIEYAKDDYSSASYDNLVQRTEEAKAILDKENPSQRDVDLALNRLNRSIKALVRKADKEELINLYNSINESIDTGEIDADKYTEESVKALKEALEASKTIIDNEQASQQEVDDSYSELVKAHKNLEESKLTPKANKEKLSLLYDQANSIDQNTLTEATAKNLKAALEKAYEILNKEDASQQEVGQAYELLEKSINDKKIKADKDAINSLLEKYNELDKEEYTEDSYGEFEKVLNKAKEVAKDTEASQEEVDKVLNDLLEAFENLEKKEIEVNLREKLEELVKKAESEVKKSGYSRQSISILKRKIYMANRTLKNNNSTDEDLQKQIDDLEFAINNLK